MSQESLQKLLNYISIPVFFCFVSCINYRLFFHANYGEFLLLHSIWGYIFFLVATNSIVFLIILHALGTLRFFFLKKTN